MKSLTIDFGIDLGTTNSTIAKINGVDTEVFKNNEGFEFTPSAIWMDSRGRIHVGRRAKDQLENDPGNAFSEFKLQMGTENLFTFERSKKKMSPKEFSAEVLKSLKEDVRRQLGEEVTSVVITVPAAFELPQCQATNEAAELAGFTYHPLLQEPIAAAMAYGFQSETTKKFWMVYDFGGGTFDASVIQLQDGQIEVVNHGGDNGLGGKKIDWEIVDSLLVPAVVKEHNLKNFKRNNETYKGAFAKLKSEAEKAKIRLSLDDSVEIYIDNLFKNEKGEAVEFTYELLRSDFEKLANPYIIRSINICKKVLLEKRLGTSNIEKMIMVGGTSLIPYLREMLLDPNEGLGIPLESSIYPITVVAKGAAIFASTQRIPFNPDTEVQKDEFLLELEYEPVGPDSEPPIGGRVVTDKPVSFDGYTVEFINKTVRPEWRSGKVALNPEGGFISQLWAEKGKKNEFLIELFDKTGVRQKTVPERLTYTMGMSSVAAPLSHSLGIEMANKETDFLLVKGAPLPSKNKSIHINVNEIRKGQPGDDLVIPIVEGENKLKAHHNRRVGELIIQSDKIPRTIPANSEIEITLVMDTSRLVTVKAYVPIIDEEYEVEKYLIIEPGEIPKLKSEFSEDKQKFEELNEKAAKESDTRASEILNQIVSENMILEIENLLVSGEYNSESRLEVTNRVLDFKTILDYAEEALEWPSLIDRANEIIKKAEDISDEHGTPDDKQKFPIHKKEIQKAIEGKDSDLLRRRIGQMDSFYWSILLEQPDFWIGCFGYAKEDLNSSKNINESEDAIRQGERAIQNNDVDGLKAAVRKLWELSPSTQQKTPGLGGGTISV
ncbi:MAG: Hsp70 family protein [Bacteroidetes bacterium]|nr:Hsp70 family protein [Bacteroidota bacterium]